MAVKAFTVEGLMQKEADNKLQVGSERASEREREKERMRKRERERER